MSAVDQESEYELTRDSESLGGKNRRGLLVAISYAVLFWIILILGFSGVFHKLVAWAMTPY